MRFPFTANQTQPDLNRVRVEWVDIAKAIGICLVIFGHLLENFLRTGSAVFPQQRFVYAFHLPLFFCIAGFFWKKRTASLEREIWRLIKVRLVPVVFFSLLLLPCWLFKFHLENGSFQLFEIKFRLLHYFRGHTELNFVMWFIICLSVTEVFAFLLLAQLQTKVAQAAVACITLGLGLAVCAHQEYFAALIGVEANTWYWQEAIVALGFYMIGHAAYPYLCIVLQRPFIIRAMLAVVFFELAMLTARLNQPEKEFIVYMTNGRHGQPVYFIFTALTGILGVIFTASLLRPNRLFSLIGASTLGLLGLNGFFQDFANPALARSIGTLFPSWVIVALSLAATFFTVLACLPLAVWLNTRWPMLVGGSRGNQTAPPKTA